MKKVRWGLFIAYCLFIVWYTILSRQPSSSHSVKWQIMWAYREMLVGYKYWKEDVIQNLQNIVFFIPFGLFHPLTNWKTVLLTTIIFSVLIEAVQYIGGFGLAELDDVICNTLGALIGFGILSYLKRKLQDAT